MRSAISLVLVLSVAVCFDRPAAAQQQVEQETSPVAPIPTGRRGPFKEAGQAIPPGYRMVERPRTRPLVLGAVLFGVTYGITAAIGLLAILIDSQTDSDDHEKLLVVPLAGPIAVMAANGEFDAFFLGDTILQLAGIGLIVFGATTTSPKLVPMAVAHGSGFALSGTF